MGLLLRHLWLVARVGSRHLGVGRGLPDVDAVERQAGGLQPLVVAGYAVAVEEPPGWLAGGRRLCACGLLGAGERQRERKDERANGYS